MSTANERQVGGTHYKTGGVELWEMYGPGALMFYATKYMRWRKKGGVKDLQKAQHIAQKLRECVSTRGWTRPDMKCKHDEMVAWCKAMDLTWTEQVIVMRINYWTRVEDIDEAIEGLEYLIQVSKQTPSTKLTDSDQVAIGFSSASLRVMTDDELAKELERLQTAQAAANSWGAAVGVRGGMIADVKAEQARRMRRVPRMVADTPSCGDGLADDHARQRVAEKLKMWQPWEIDRETLQKWGAGSAVKHAAMSVFYKQVTLNVYRLEPVVTSRVMPTELGNFYSAVRPDVWLLRIDKCPASLRDGFPRVLMKQNAVGWGELPEWQRELYEWSESGQQYRLLDMHSAWRGEEE